VPFCYNLVTLSLAGQNTETWSFGLGVGSWELDARLTTLPYKKCIVTKSKEVNTGLNIWKHFSGGEKSYVTRGPLYQ
jgi:hypothetical protein